MRSSPPERTLIEAWLPRPWMPGSSLPRPSELLPAPRPIPAPLELVLRELPADLADTGQTRPVLDDRTD